MKRLHRSDLYGWSVFDEGLNIDFHSVLWVRPEGNVVIDPLPLRDHDGRPQDQALQAAEQPRRGVAGRRQDHARERYHAGSPSRGGSATVMWWFRGSSPWRWKDPRRRES